MTSKTKLVTTRLELRSFQKTDYAQVHEYSSDSTVTHFMTWGPNTTEETHNFIKKTINYQKEKPQTHYPLAIVTKNQNRLIGGCGIIISNIENSQGYIGYCLNQKFWGQGYATETAHALLNFGFNHLNLHRIFAFCDPANTASSHIMEKIGMKYEGHFRENTHYKNGWHDEVIYAILKKEWKSK
ncbi:MAG: GNAT family N-acetyltransferase [Candidatus Bathyarchaeota archaeon]|nr:GNAT family N-acetyltransferase [Candidatus Termiticorpusculum sp.]